MKAMLAVAVMVLIGTMEAHAVVLCARPRSDGTFNTSIKLREVCKSSETQLDPTALGLTGPQGPTGSQGAMGLPGIPAWERPCPNDSVKVGTACVDKYEASVWRIPMGQTTLIGKVTDGTAVLADLLGGGATQLGVGVTDDYAPCGDSGQDCG